MNILFLCDEYPPGRHGGIGTAVRLLARQLVCMGHTVVVAGLYCPGYGGEDEFEDEGVKVYRYRKGINTTRLETAGTLPMRILNRLLKDSGVLQRDVERSLTMYGAKLQELIKRYQVEIVEMPDYNDYVRFCKSYVPFPQLPVPVVVKMHGSISYFTTEARQEIPRHVYQMERDVLRKASAVASVSAYTAKQSAVCLASDKISVLYNGIDIRIKVETEKIPNQVIFTGSLMRKKGIFQLAKAWNMVIVRRPDARLLILGKGDIRPVKAMLNAEATNTVVFKGHVDADELYRDLSASQVGVFPSYSESLGLAPLEAMACGTAVINSCLTTGPELIDDGKSGILVDPGNVEQIASAVLHLLNHPEVCQKLVEAAHEKVKRFDIELVARNNVDFYRQTLAGG